MGVTAALLPQYVLQAIEEEFGASTDQGWKARHDAEVLLTQYHLSPEEWSEAAFQRMAKGNGWMNSTFDHQWYIFRRLLRRLRRSSQSSDSRPLLFSAVLPEKTPDLLVEAVPSEFEANGGADSRPASRDIGAAVPGGDGRPQAGICRVSFPAAGHRLASEGLG